MSADLMLVAKANPDAQWRKAFNTLRASGGTFSLNEYTHAEEDKETGLWYLLDERGVRYADDPMLPFETWESLMREVDEGTDCFWIGQVSWLKAGLLGDYDTFVPGPVSGVSRVIGEDTVLLTEGIRGALLAAMNLPNHSIYGKRTIEKVDDDWYQYVVETYYGPVRQRTDYMQVPLGFNRILHRKPKHQYQYAMYSGSGVAPRQHLKRWLNEHMGEHLYLESV